MLHNAAEQGWGVTPAAQREALGLEARAMLAQREAVYQARMQDFEQQEADRAAGLGQGMAKYQQDREEYQRRLAAWQQNQEEWRQYQQQLTEWGVPVSHGRLHCVDYELRYLLRMLCRVVHRGLHQRVFCIVVRT